MEPLCPDCLAPLDSADGQTARCTTHGGQYQILFTRVSFLSPALAEMPPVILDEGAVCALHPSVTAAHACYLCGTAICSTCDFSQPDGTHLCPTCAPRQASAPPVLTAAEPAVPETVHCVQHPNLRAVAKCKVCGGFMCQTCTFDLPGGIKICPTCATATPKLSPKRKKMLIASYVLAVWCTIGMAAVFGGMFRGMVRDKSNVAAADVFLRFFVFIPSIIGVALGVSSMDKRLPNSIGMWIATVWNGVILAGYILLMIVGMVMGGVR